MLDEVARSNASQTGRKCSNEHYLRHYNPREKNFFRDETEMVTPPLRENYYCSNKTIPIYWIRLGCRRLGNYQPDNLESFQLITLDQNGSLVYNPIQGDTGVNSRYYLDITLNGASEVAFEFWGADFQDPQLRLVREEIWILTYDARGKMIDEIKCGDYFDHQRQGEVWISTSQFLGFWYNFDGERNIQRLGVISYKSN